ncbi:hypothetical protein ACTA71_005308 [Dictyostelium dimigraforme]
MKKIIIIIFLLFLKNVTESNNCQYKNQNNNQFFDLTSLKLNSDKSYTSTSDSSSSTKYTYLFNFCNTSIKACNSAEYKDVTTACQIPESSSTPIQLGSTLTNETFVFTTDGLILTYTSQISSTSLDCVDKGKKRTVNFNFKCDETVGPFSVWQGAKEMTSLCTYDIYIKSNLVCMSCPGCSTHGKCDGYTGICVCDKDISGDNCTIWQVNINSLDSTTVNGGTTIVHGYFGSSTTNKLSIKIDLLCNNIHLINETTITCDIGPGEGIKDVTITDGDLSNTFKELFQYTYLSCPKCSTIHGKCNVYTGICVCDKDISGDDCTIWQVNIDSLDSTTVNGGTTIVHGYFGSSTTNDFSIKIGDLQCINIHLINETTITCDIGPGEGIKDVTITDGDLSNTFKELFQYTYLSCPNCSKLHGTCNVYTGDCICDSKTSGSNCSTSRIYINSIDSTTVNGGTTILNGYFGNSKITTTINNPSIKIGDLQCNNIIKSNETTIKCDIGPGEGIKDVILIDDDLSFIGKQLFQYTKIILSCPNNCTSPSNGLCNTATGVCSCFNGFTGITCNSKENSNTDIPSSKSNINETTGEATISNDNSRYIINVYSLVEFNHVGSIINEIELLNQWKSSSIIKNDDDNNNISIFLQNVLNGSCIIEYSIEQVIGKNKDYSFAGINYSLPPGSLKLTIAVHNYTYQSTLNSIQLRINSSINNNEQSDCNSKELDINTDFKNDQSLNYLIISKDSKTFFGRFINKVISDGRETFMSTSIINQENGSIHIGLNLPHCTKTCLIDPDFSLLVDTDFKTTCENGDSKRKWILPISIAIPIIVTSFILKNFLN